MNVQSIQPTPNPNAFKFVLDAALAPGGTRQFEKPEDAREDLLATALFAVPGIETLFYFENVVTVSMTPDADWRQVAESVTRILEGHEAPAAPGGAPEPPPEPVGDDPVARFRGDGDQELLARVNAILDDRVRPALAGDGGGLEVVGLQGKTLHIRYQGACGSCPSSIQGTLFAIQNMLQNEVDEELVVTPA